MTPEIALPRTRSLWAALHDARIVDIASDHMARTVTFVAQSLHLAEHGKLPDSARLRLNFEHVRSVHAATFRHWPGECESQAGKSWAEKESIVRAYQAKGREETVRWDDMERTARAVDDLDILEADLTQEMDPVTASLSCHTSDAWYGIKVVAGVFTIEGTEGFPPDLDGVVALGEQYWEAFGNTSR